MVKKVTAELAYKKFGRWKEAEATTKTWVAFAQSWARAKSTDLYGLEIADLDMSMIKPSSGKEVDVSCRDMINSLDTFQIKA